MPYLGGTVAALMVKDGKVPVCCLGSCAVHAAKSPFPTTATGRVQPLSGLQNQRGSNAALPVASSRMGGIGGRQGPPQDPQPKEKKLVHAGEQPDSKKEPEKGARQKKKLSLVAALCCCSLPLLLLPRFV